MRNLRNARLDIGLEVLLPHGDSDMPHALQRSPPQLLSGRKQE